MNDTVLIIPKIRVYRNLTPPELLDATGRKLFTNPLATSMLSQGEGDEVDFHFVMPGPSEYVDGHLGPAEVANTYVRLGLKPDPYAHVFAQLKLDSVLKNRIPSFSVWVGTNGSRYYLDLYTWSDGELYVGTGLDDANRTAGWWLGGVPGKIFPGGEP